MWASVTRTAPLSPRQAMCVGRVGGELEKTRGAYGKLGSEGAGDLHLKSASLYQARDLSGDPKQPSRVTYPFHRRGN